MRKTLEAVVLAVVLCNPLVAHASDDVAAVRRSQDEQILQKYRAGDAKGALDLVQRGLQLDERRLGKDHPLLLMRLNVQLHIHDREIPDQEKADEARNRIAAILKKVMAGRDPEQLYIAGKFHAENNQMHAALPFFARMVEVTAATAERRPVLHAQALSALAAAHARMKEHGKAAEGFERALLLRGQQQGEAHHDLVGDLRSLAEVRTRQMEYAQAELLLKRVLAIEEKHHPDLHRSVIAARVRLAEFYVDRNDPAMGLPILNSLIKKIDSAGPLNMIRDPRLIEPLTLRARARVQARHFPEAAASLYSASRIVLKQQELTPEQEPVALHRWLSQSRILGGNLLTARQLTSLADEVYLLQLKRRDARPDLAFLLWGGAVEPDLMASGDLAAAMMRREALNGLKKMLDIREKHWPAEDAMRLRIIETLAAQEEGAAPDYAARLYARLATHHEGRGEQGEASKFHAKARALQEKARSLNGGK